MAQFVICGQSCDPAKKYFLELPEDRSRSYTQCSSKPRLDQTSEAKKYIMEAVRLSRNPSMKRYQNLPIIYSRADYVTYQQVLKEILSRHPFPLSQGPIMLPLDCAATHKTDSEVILSKTIDSY